MNGTDPFALLLEEDDEDIPSKDHQDIACLYINEAASFATLTIDAAFLEDAQYTEKMRILLRYLQSHDLSRLSQFTISVLSLDKALVLLDSDVLFGMQYLLRCCKTSLTSLVLLCSAYRDRAAPFNEMPAPLDNAVLSSMFDSMHASASDFELRNVVVSWSPVRRLNYGELTRGIVGLLNTQPRLNKQMYLSLLLPSDWLMHTRNAKALSDAFRTCTAWASLKLVFDRSAQWLTFERTQPVTDILHSLSTNPCIQRLELHLDRSDFGPHFDVVTKALAECVRNKTVLNEGGAFALSLVLNEGMFDVVSALCENERVRLSELSLRQGSAEWDNKTIALVCDVLESGEHDIGELVLDGIFISKYHFGMYKVVGFDQLVACLTKADDDDDDDAHAVEVHTVDMGTIVSDEGDEIYNAHVLSLIADSRVWLNSITVRYERLSTGLAPMMEAFFRRLAREFECVRAIEEALRGVFGAQDVRRVIVDFCKLHCFELYIVDEQYYGNGSDKAVKLEMQMQRLEYKQYLFAFAESLGMPFTPSNAEENRLELRAMARQICVHDVGIWRHSTKRADRCVSTIL